MKLHITCLSIFLLIVSCNNNKPIDIIETIENDDLINFQEHRKKIDIDTVNFFGGGTALHYALKYGSYKISKQLIKDNYKLNSVDSINLTPLLIASFGSNDRLVDLLIERSVDLNVIENKNGFTALHYAVHNNNLKLVKKLVGSNADLNIISKSDKKETPLHLALKKQNIDIINLFLKAKAVDTVKNSKNETVRDLGITSNNLKIRDVFYNRLTKNEKENLFVETVRNTKNIELLKKILNEENLSQELINESFLFSKDTLISKTLIENNAKVSYLNTTCDLGAIHYAAARGDVIMLKFLIDNGANVNQLSSKNQISPLMHAASLYDNFPVNGITKNCVELLVNKEKNKNNSLEAVKVLLENKADLHFANLSNENVLYVSEKNSNTELVDYLKSLGAIETKSAIQPE